MTLPPRPKPPTWGLHVAIVLDPSKRVPSLPADPREWSYVEFMQAIRLSYAEVRHVAVVQAPPTEEAPHAEHPDAQQDQESTGADPA